MNQKMKILIAYDGSQCADVALNEMARAGLPEESVAMILTVADVVLPPPIPPVPGIAEPLLSVQTPAAAREWRERAFRAVDDAYSLAAQAAEMVKKRFPAWTLSASSDGDSPAWAIINKAEEWGADLIIVGSHGRSALGRFFLGSVSQKVMSDAHCSVLIARASGAHKDKAARLVIGVDGSPGSKAAVDAVAKRRWPEGTEARLVSALAPLMAPAMEWFEEDFEDEQEWLQKMLDAEAEKLRSAGLKVEAIIKEADPKRALVEEAESWKADCIFVGARGLRRIEKFLIGSISSSVAARAHCSVEVVRG
jgi:nucleotide-binding universal stress UspA family protein